MHSEAKIEQGLRPINLTQPNRIAFGAGCHLQAVDLVASHGYRSVALFASRSTSVLAQEIVDHLAERQVTVHVSSPCPAEPSFADAQAAIRWTEETKADCVIGFGGGSVIDIAKIAAAVAFESRELNTFVGKDLLPKRTLGLLAIPTTAGAGSEVSPNAIFLDTDEQSKKGIISPWLVPDAAFVDPTLSTSLPKTTTAATALDALSHCVEAFANRNAHPAVDIYAQKGIQLIFQNLTQALVDPDDLEARSALALGSLYGGLCLGPVNTAAIHALSYPLGSEFHIPHGLSNALLMPHVLRFNAEASPEKYAEIADLLDLEPPTPTVESKASHAIDAIEQLSRACQIPMTLSECNVPESAIPRMAKAACKITRLLVNNLREITEEDAARIYRLTF